MRSHRRRTQHDLPATGLSDPSQTDRIPQADHPQGDPVTTSESCVPGAQLLESMRAVGYSLETAIADIVDNSIAAGATSIAINFSMDVATPYLTILDNGSGMSPEEARNAMRLAGVAASASRAPADLGRFGLGLKTASLSQCRRLTVVTKQGGVTTGLAWDLDHVTARDDWSLLVLDQAEINGTPKSSELEAMETGTLVVWTKLDRIHDQTEEVSAEFDSQMVEARAHLALIFHQYLGGDAGLPRVTMTINSEAVEGLDPFLRAASGTERSPVETISVQGRSIEVQSFTLPYLNEMSQKQRRLAAVPGQLRDSQGFYIYRGGRLLIWGTWFRLHPKTEGGKLSRVKVDIPNSLDHLWSLDIKKSRAVPPVEVRDRLKRLAAALVEPSERKVTYRGRKEKGDDRVTRVWDAISDRDSFRYQINRSHPILEQLADRLEPQAVALLDSALELIEFHFPAQDLVNRFRNDLVPAQAEESAIRQQMLEIWRAGNGSLGPPSEFVAWISKCEPWNVYEKDTGVLLNWLEEDSGPTEGD